MSLPALSNGPLVEVEDLHTYYGKSHILDGVSLTVGRGEVVGLLGRNGVGKSTTLKTIMGIVNPARGQDFPSFDRKRLVSRSRPVGARLAVYRRPRNE